MTIMNQSKVQTTDNNNSSLLQEVLTGKSVYVISFLVPIMIMTIIFFLKGMFPFGEECYLRSDMYHQYCPFYSELWNKLRNGESLSYSWDIGMGTNFTAIFGYYLSSPTNWFIGLFPQKAIIEVMDIFIILKMAASSFTMTFFLCKKRGSIHISSAIFGMFYGLSGFLAAYSWNLMWLDCVLLLPLIFLGLERLVNEGRGLLYVISLGLAILSNYYIAIMICIALVFYFIVLLISCPAKDAKSYLKNILHFSLYSILAGGLAAVLLFPEIMALEYTASSDISFPDSLSRYFSFLSMIVRQFFGVETSFSGNNNPNNYCGVFVIPLIIMYFFRTKISLRERLAKGSLLVIFFLAFNLNIPNFIWHGFHFPNSLPARESFIYIFVLLTMCAQAFDGLYEKEKVSYKNSVFRNVALCVCGLLVVIGNCLDDFELNFKYLYITGGFIFLYFLLFLIIRKDTAKKAALSVVIFVIAIIECTLNSNLTGYSPTSRTEYLRDYDSVKEITDRLETADTDFYRVSKLRGYRSKNDSAFHNYRGVSVFSSTAYSALTDFFDSMGCESSFNSYAINGATPVIYSLYNVKYLLSNIKIATDEDVFSLVDQSGNEYLYRNNYALPVAYGVNSTFPEEFADYGNVFDHFKLQNSFSLAATGIDDVLTPIYYDEGGTTATYVVERDMYLYAHCTNSAVESLTVNLNGAQGQTYDGINHNRTVDIGFVKEGTTVNISTTNSEDGNISFYMYELNIEKYKEMIEECRKYGLQVTEHDSSSIKGTISLTPDKSFLLTSIPFDEGFTVSVDGEAVEYTNYANKSFIGVDLSEYADGNAHTIEFSYKTRGLSKGFIVTLLSGLLVCFFIVFRVISKKEITEDGSFIALKERLDAKKEKRAAKKVPVSESSEDSAETENVADDNQESEDE